MRRAVWGLALSVLVYAGPASAQGVQYLSRFDFVIDGEHLSGDDERFVWDANFGGALDVVDYGTGRITVTSNYRVVMGEQLRAFDPNQGDYVLEGTGSRRFGGVELAGVFYHQSRHLSDRIKNFAVAWNSLGGRLSASRTVGRAQLDGGVDLRKVVGHNFVDYTWELETEGQTQYTVRPRVAAFGSGALRVVGVNGSKGRGTQTGARGEGGVRFLGDGAAADLFLAVERRIDPYQLEFSTMTWVTAGLRLSSRR